MILKLSPVILLLLCAITQQTFAQRCGTVEYEKLRRARNSSLPSPEDFENWMKGKISERKSRQQRGERTQVTTYVIPVVIHIIHNGEPVGTGTNISDAQILSQMPVLNNDFQRLNTDAVNTLQEFQSVAGSLNIQFVLAKQDPNGYATNGIVRVKGTKTSWSSNDDVTLKALSYWPAENYYNIWVTDLSGGLLGYTQFPLSPPSPNAVAGLGGTSTDRVTDGVVIDYQTFGTAQATGGADFNLLSEYNLGRTVTHETGHFFGLRHIWGDDNGTCSGTDYVDDTPNQADSYNGKCPSGSQQSCGTDNMYQNYMDYTDDACMNLFSQGQGDRMTIIIENSVRRASLLTSPGASDPVSMLTPLFANENQISTSLTKGTGASCAVFINASTSGTVPVVDNTTYTANTTFGLGSSPGSGWYCVYNGSAFSQLDVTGLTPGTSYRMQVVDYDGGAGSEQYINQTNINNPIQVSTYTASPQPAYSFLASSQAFTALSSGTAVNTIEADEAISDAISIGFNFYIGGESFSQLRASSNGFLSFNQYLSDSYSTNSLNSSYAKPAVAPLWDDLDGTSGQASYKLSGIAPNRVFTFEYLNWKWNAQATGTGISFQVLLHETSNQVEYRYRQESGSLTNPSASIGLAFADIQGSYSFLSLSNSSSNPDYSNSLETSIDTKPATDQVYSFSPTRFDQSITFTPLASATYGDPAITLGATSSASLPITYSSSNSTFARIAGSTLTIAGAGTANITASQPGDGNYNAAVAVIQPITITKEDQSISFGDFTNKNVTDSPFALSASATSKLAVSYTSSNTSVATVSNNTITITGAGESDITASQSGNNNFLPATSVTKTLTIIDNRITGIENNQSMLTIAPNPANDYFRIDASDLPVKEIKAIVLDITGRTIESAEGYSTLLFDVSAYAKGTYIVRIQNGTQVIARKMVKN